MQWVLLSVAGVCSTGFICVRDLCAVESWFVGAKLGLSGDVEVKKPNFMPMTLHRVVVNVVAVLVVQLVLCVVLVLCFVVVFVVVVVVEVVVVVLVSLGCTWFGGRGL